MILRWGRGEHDQMLQIVGYIIGSVNVAVVGSCARALLQHDSYDHKLSRGCSHKSTSSAYTPGKLFFPPKKLKIWKTMYV